MIACSLFKADILFMTRILRLLFDTTIILLLTVNLCSFVDVNDPVLNKYGLKRVFVEDPKFFFISRFQIPAAEEESFFPSLGYCVSLCTCWYLYCS